MSKVKFGDIVREVKVNVDRENNPYEFYVAGDHMDSEDLTIRRKGRFDTDDVGPAFTRIFKPGQILYGSRRTYLKKVAVADFEGICANTTFVLESKDPNVFCQELLPFIMLSDEFSKWSIGHSKGSTNPYVLFSDLAGYEFDLPSIEEQKVLADKLWAAYRVKESYRQLLATTEKMVEAKFNDMFGKGTETPICKLPTVCTFKSGTTFKDDEEACTGEYLYIKVADMNLEGNEYNITRSSKYVSKDTARNTWLPAGSVIFPKRGAAIATNKKRLLIQPTCVDLNIIGVIPSSKVDPVYLYWFFKGMDLSTICDDSGIPQINNKNLTPVDIPIPSIELQQEFAAIATQAEATKASLRASIEAIDRVIKSLINQ